jgi:hypothetical protein
VEKIDPYGQMPNLLKVRESLFEIYKQLDQPENFIEQREYILTLFMRLATQFPKDENRLRDVGETMYFLTALYHQYKLYEDFFSLLEKAIQVYHALQAMRPNVEEYKMKLGYLIGSVAYYHEKFSHNLKAMMVAADKSYKILSAVERNSGAEQVYQSVKRIREQYPVRENLQSKLKGRYLR